MRTMAKLFSTFLWVHHLETRTRFPGLTFDHGQSASFWKLLTAAKLTQMKVTGILKCPTLMTDFFCWGLKLLIR